MNLYALDSDILSLFERGDPTVKARCASVLRSNLCVTVISVEEILSGWYTLLRKAKARPQLARAYYRLAESVQFLGGLAILPFSEPAIERFEQLKSQRLGIRAPDLRIAAIALESQAIVVTRNLRDFRLVPGLACEDWSQP
jgi:tRNA(fMet)-specific endonuclease VapC